MVGARIATIFVPLIHIVRRYREIASTQNLPTLAKQLSMVESCVKAYGVWLARKNIQSGVDQFRTSFESLQVPASVSVS